MTQISFYHLHRWPLDQALPRLAEKVLGANHRLVIRVGSEERLAWLDDLLWTFDAASWLAHGRADDTENAPHQPILLTLDDTPPANGAAVLMLVDGTDTDHPDRYDRCLVLFNGHDADELAEARARYRRWREAGYPLSYYQQTDHGGWTQKA